ncbi:MAG TPA: 5'-3' exonuclease H3TH domain-containing protein [Acidobacteriaceae bacterium]|jgi:5'-3' exonuclease|nr:5'-3' exonuclease H3TH domain-containing protein [Acidobacteriaceae bacterium]
MEIYLIDGTYELFRHFFAVPLAKNAEGRQVGAVKGVVQSIRGMLRSGATHIGVATDHVIESFRNRLWEGYKDGSGVDPLLLEQFSLLEEALEALGVKVWPMVEFEADDALAAAAAKAAEDPKVERVLICTPDKDLAQCVRGTRVVQMDRRKQAIRDEAEVVSKFGVKPELIPDYLALVGDSADGYPGLKGFGAKGTAALLSKFGGIETIPEDAALWPKVNGAQGLAAILKEQKEKALLFRALATLRTDVPVFDSVEELRWGGPSERWPAMEARLKTVRA